MICPFFHKNENFCDVGSGYISTHDVKLIVTFCQSRYRDCSKLQELARCFSQQAAQGEQFPEGRELPHAVMESLEFDDPGRGTVSCFVSGR